MARYPEYELLYSAYEMFRENCLLRDGSLLWPEKKIWTRKNLQDLRTRFIDSAILNPWLSFEEKLQEQLKGAPAELWALLADIYYVYFLPSDFITIEKKLKDTQWAAQQAGLRTPPPEDPVWVAQTSGFTRTGQRYHQKYLQFWLILLFALHIKESENPEGVLNNPEEMQRALDQSLELVPKTDRAYDMRHALLFLAFPDIYERIISTQDKRKIIKTFHETITGDIPEDPDQALRMIREGIAPKYQTDERLFDFYTHVKPIWKPVAEPTIEDGRNPTKPGREPIIPIPISEDPDQLRVRAILNYTKNVILYGPPGTGKTYIAREVAKALIAPQLNKGLTEKAVLVRAVDGLTFYQILALSIYQEGSKKSFSVPEINQQKLVQAHFAVTPIKHQNNQIWGYLQSHTDPGSDTVKYAAKSPPYLFNKSKDSRWFLTEDGCQYVEENLGDRLTLLQPKKEVQLQEDDFIRWATFHQSYAYEDFVEGLRPKISEEAQESISYEITPGVFREICTLASQDPDNKYVLVIDEINRGNIAKILGELITLLEDDKRDDLNVTLPYSKDAFSVPGNLYLIGTMNTADRSIALLDVALRRRFAFVEILPRLDLLKDALVESEGPSVHLDALLRNLNTAISRHIDRDHQIGHSYLLKVKMAEEEQRLEVLDYVWNNQIIPLLEEYFYSQQDKLKEVLAPFVTPIESSMESGEGNWAMQLSIGRAHGEDLMDSLSRLAGNK
jgi:MoxR-like ATPase